MTQLVDLPRKILHRDEGCLYQIQAMYKAKCEANYDKIERGVTLFLAYPGDFRSRGLMVFLDSVFESYISSCILRLLRPTSGLSI